MTLICHRAFRIVALLPALMAAVGVTFAANELDESLKTLFQPLNHHEEVNSPPAGPGPLDRFEFRGIITIGTESFVTLLDTSTSRTSTRMLGEKVDGLCVTDFQSTDNSIQLSAPGQMKRLTLRETKIVAAGPPDPRSSPATSRHRGIRRRPGGHRPHLGSTPVVDQLAPR